MKSKESRVLVRIVAMKIENKSSEIKIDFCTVTYALKQM
jgi:hypothetical protein